MLARKRTGKEKHTLLLVKHTYTRSFNTTHWLMLAIERADKKRNRLILVDMHTHRLKTRPFSKTHWLKLAMERPDKKRNKLLQV